MKQPPHRDLRASLSAAIVIALTATAAMPTPGFAQQATATADAQQAPEDAAASGDATELDAVTVTGYRHSIEESLERKRNANAVVEVITAEDVSRFPDKNVADSLQRVPGVFISRDGGEGSRVSIRGLRPDLVLTQLNGNFIAPVGTNEEPTRSFNYVLLPSNMISSVEVFKSAEARIDEGGVGGTVILHTRRPLEMEANTGFVSAEGTYADTTESIDPQLSGLYSWRSQDARFGFLAGVTHQRRTNRSMEATTETWRWWTDRDADGNITGPRATDVNGNPYANDAAISYWPGSGVYDQSGNHYTGYWAPQSVNFGIRDEERERTGFQLTTQFRPTDDLTLTANYFRFKLEGDYTQHLNKIPEWGYSDNPEENGRFFAGANFDPSGTVMTGARFEVPPGGCTDATPQCAMETPQLSGYYSREQALSQTFDLAVEHRGDRFDMAFKGGRTWSEGGPSMMFRMSAKPRYVTDTQQINGNTLSAWDLTGTPSMQFAPNIQDNLMAGIAQVDTGSTDSSWNETRIAQTYAQADFTRYFDNSDWFDSFQFGAKYRRGTVHRNTGNTYWYCPGTETRYQDCDRSGAGVAHADFFLSEPIDNIPGGIAANTFPGIDFPAYIRYLDERYGGPVRHREENFVYDVEEDIWSAYGQLNVMTERLRGNLGVRVARTRQYAESTDRILRLINYYVDGPGGPFSPPACCDTDGLPYVIPIDERQFETYEPIGQDRSYTDVLPSLNVAYDLTPDLLLRGAAAKVIARPAYTDLASQQSFTYIDATREYDRRQFGEREGWSGGGGNKNLEPYEAWQYDLGLEWYFRPGSVLGLGLFRKEIDNFIVPLIIDQQVMIGDELVLVEPYSTQANGSDAVSQGVELYAQHTFAFGLGFQANYTYNDTSTSDITAEGEVIGQSPLVGSARNQANVSVFYENERFLVRASYNRRGEVVQGIVSGLNVYTEPYDQIDLNASYQVLDGLTLTGSVINLTESEQREHLGDDTKARFYSNRYSGRLLYLGLTYKF